MLLEYREGGEEVAVIQSLVNNRQIFGTGAG